MSELKPIDNFPDYFVDVNGNVYRKFVPDFIDRNGNQYKRLRPGTNVKWQRHIVLCKNGTKHTKRIAPLVLRAFIGEPKGNEQCCHGKNGRLDDSLGNLSWGSRSKNNGEDKIRDGTTLRGTRNHKSKITECDVLKIRQLRGRESAPKIGKRFGISATQVSLIQLRKRWAWLK